MFYLSDRNAPEQHYKRLKIKSKKVKHYGSFLKLEIAASHNY